MAQVALPFDVPSATPAAQIAKLPSPAAQAASADPIASEIGRDFARHRLAPPVEHLQAESPIYQAWRAGSAAFGLRTLPATPRVRLWLQLRLRAWMQGVVFEDVQVTPHHLQQLELAHCPVTREPLTRATHTGTDGRVDRINHAAAFAAGNLAMLCAQACQAKGALTATQLWAVACELNEDLPGAAARRDGLDAPQWSRLAVLTSFATPLPHATAALLPLTVLPPNRLRVLNPVQALQVMLSLQFTRAGYAQRLASLAALMPTSEVRAAFQVFMHTLLARHLDAGQAQDNAAARRAIEDTWADPLVNRRWQRLALRLTEGQCEQVLQHAARRGLAGTKAQWLSQEQACEGWALASGGYVQLPAATPPQEVGEVLNAMPGKLRSLGSQNVASCEAFTALGAFQ